VGGALRVGRNDGREGKLRLGYLSESSEVRTSILTVEAEVARFVVAGSPKKIFWC